MVTVITSLVCTCEACLSVELVGDDSNYKMAATGVEKRLLHALAIVILMTAQVRSLGRRGRALRWHLRCRLGKMTPLLMSLRVLFREDLLIILPIMGGMQL